MGTVMITMYCMLCTLFKRRHFRAEELERFGDILRLTKQAMEQRGVSRMQRSMSLDTLIEIQGDVKGGNLLMKDYGHPHTKRAKRRNAAVDLVHCELFGY